MTIRLKVIALRSLTLAAALSASTALAQPPRPSDPPPAPVAPQPPRPGDTAREAAPANGPSAEDQAFAKKAAEGGQKEVALARLAAQKAASEQVKAYAQTLERDHQQANDELKSWASAKNVTLPAAPADGKVDAKLSALEGAAFDKAYIAAMIQDHRKDIAAFEKQARSGSDADLKAFVEKALPTLKGHLEQAEKAQAAVGGKRSSS